MATAEIPFLKEQLPFERAERFGKRLARVFEQANVALDHKKETLEAMEGLAEKHKISDFLIEFSEADPETFSHSMRMAATAYDIALEAEVPAELREGVLAGTMLHDNGKRSIDEAILMKPGKLTDDERKKIEEHALMGLKNLLEDKRFASAARVPGVKEITIGHHGYKKSVDGTRGAYPFDLSDSEHLPEDFYGMNVKGWDERMRRVVAISAAADMFDSAAHDRPYAKALESSEEIFTRLKLTSTLPDDLILYAVRRFAK